MFFYKKIKQIQVELQTWATNLQNQYGRAVHSISSNDTI